MMGVMMMGVGLLAKLMGWKKFSSTLPKKLMSLMTLFLLILEIGLLEEEEGGGRAGVVVVVMFELTLMLGVALVLEILLLAVLLP